MYGSEGEVRRRNPPIDSIKSIIGVIRFIGWGNGKIEKYFVMVEDGTFFYTELNGFDI